MLFFIACAWVGFLRFAVIVAYGLIAHGIFDMSMLFCVGGGIGAVDKLLWSSGAPFALLPFQGGVADDASLSPSTRRIPDQVFWTYFCRRLVALAT